MKTHLEKQKLRTRILKKLAVLSLQSIKRRSKDVEQNFCSLPIYNYAKVIMGYYPLRDEPDILGILRKAIESKKEICFPVMDLKKKTLEAYKVSDLSTKNFVTGPYRIKEPNIKKSIKIDITRIDIVIVPGVCFDYQKNRLGRGGGFYDKFLATLSRPTQKIAVAFDFQVIDCLPINTRYDQSVDIIVTENFII